MKQAHAMVLVRFPQENTHLFGHGKTNVFVKARDVDRWPVFHFHNGKVWSGYFRTVKIGLRVDPMITSRLSR